MTRQQTRPIGRTLRGVPAVAVTALVASLLAGTTAAQAESTENVRAAHRWTIRGHGYGHGHGMSQYGAEGAARQGLHYRSIARFYYPKTHWDRGRGRVRVLISADTTSDVQVRPARGLTVRDLTDNARWELPTSARINRWRMKPTRDGRTSVEYHDRSGWSRWNIPGRRTSFRSDGQFSSASGRLTLLVPGGARTYRGFLRSVRPRHGSSDRDTVNVVGLDAYIQGVVPYEMPTSWHQQALRAQAVAARTFAVWGRSQNRHGYYQLCDTTTCQVYGGMSAETHASNRAVAGTARKILTFRGSPAMTQFSSSSGGWTAAGGEPYLPAKPDGYDRFPGNSMHSWKVSVRPSSLARSYPSIGRLKSMRITRRDGHGQWNGRVEQVRVVGTSGSVRLSGDDIRWHFGLRSTWFDVSTGGRRAGRAEGGRTSVPTSNLGVPRDSPEVVG